MLKKRYPNIGARLINAKHQDDEKFADCAVASNVDYLVTNDKHFEVLKRIDFPIIQVVNDKEFEVICKRRGILL